MPLAIAFRPPSLVKSEKTNKLISPKDSIIANLIALAGGENVLKPCEQHCTDPEISGKGETDEKCNQASPIVQEKLPDNNSIATESTTAAITPSLNSRSICNTIYNSSFRSQYLAKEVSIPEEDEFVDNFPKLEDHSAQRKLESWLEDFTVEQNDFLSETNFYKLKYSQAKGKSMIFCWHNI